MLRNVIRKLSPGRIIILAYVLGIIVFTLLLKLPISLKPGVKLPLIDALFTAASAVSVTGLTTIGTSDTFSVFGIFMLMAAFQFGGVGIMTLGSFYWLMMGQNIGLLERKLIMIDQNRNQLAGLVSLMKVVLVLTLTIELMGTLLFGFYFYAIGYTDSLPYALFNGMFHTVSAFTNAGFDLFGDSLLRYSKDYFVQSFTMLLIILGAIGFPVMAELWEFVRSRRMKNKRFRFSLFTKVTLSAHGILLLLGAIIIWLTEAGHSFAHMSFHRQLMSSLFTSVTSRSAGLTIVDVSSLHHASLLLISGLMFLGASPSSMGGGIRTTTIAIIALVIIAFARGERVPRAYNRSISMEDVIKSFVFFSLAVLLVLIGIFAVFLSEAHQFDLTAVLFEVTSAFGTCGLSTGITGSLHLGSKITLIILMFIGRIGMFLFISLFSTGKRKPDIRYPEEKLIIG
ncbi:Trk-type K+ transport system membrane component [Paenibacillus taihuensis]|uniref:Trk-type K+ transport system membrane component n=1 Tax=Paenibacillus taihuensis TaxID=1156355 RepID=A0A3D9SD95_9BACL|nr:TrkH family potassium uptake protein [Paenibacillus taihuensis]REE92832.1 Trk-type K+ transport system membrane component [Paenibacillus taihuensis]